jgi:predicted transcriptional regulator
VCTNGEENSDNFFSTAEKREKRLQRRFIKKHLATNGHRLRHKFLKDIVHDDVDEDTVKSLSNRRSKRDDSSTNESQDSASPDVETVLTDLADQDIVEVDIIMDDIYDEIKDLQVLILLFYNETL